MSQHRPTEGEIRELVDAVLKEFCHGFKDALGSEDAHPFADVEDEDAFRELLVNGTTRNKDDLWDKGKSTWKHGVEDSVKHTAEKHGKRCGQIAKNYKKSSISLARALAELKELKNDCVLIPQRDGTVFEVRGRICDF
jgi:hypothetical protein